MSPWPLNTASIDGRRTFAEVALGGGDVEDAAIRAQPERETVRAAQGRERHALR